MDTRSTIINAVAERQRIYEAKKVRALASDRDPDSVQFDKYQHASEVCSNVLHDVLTALGLDPADKDADELIEPVPEITTHG